MSREEAMAIVKEDINCKASVAIVGKYCSDATYGADHTIEEWLQIKLPEYRRKFADNMGVTKTLFDEMFGKQ